MGADHQCGGIGRCRLDHDLDVADFLALCLEGLAMDRMAHCEQCGLKVSRHPLQLVRVLHIVRSGRDCPDMLFQPLGKPALFGREGRKRALMGAARDGGHP
jgi:hypothetical protein